MSGKHPTEKERARQAERLARIREESDSKTDKTEIVEQDDDTIVIGTEPLSVGRAYSPRGLQIAMGIGRSYYDTLISRGLPRKRIGQRYWHSGTKVIDWIESEPDDGEQAI